MDRFWLESHPWERDLRRRHGCAAIGGPDKSSDAAVMLFVVRKDPSLTKEALTAYCHHLLTGYRRPIEFREELPKTNVGKILRRALRDDAMRKAA